MKIEESGDEDENLSSIIKKFKNFLKMKKKKQERRKKVSTKQEPSNKKKMSSWIDNKDFSSNKEE